MANGEKQGYHTLTDSEINGFQALLAGSLDDEGNYKYKDEAGNFWTSNSYDVVTAGWVTFSKNIQEIKMLQAAKNMSFSCRCIEDPEYKEATFANTNNTVDQNSASKNTTPVTQSKTAKTTSADTWLKGSIIIQSEPIAQVNILPDEGSKIEADLKVGKKKSNDPRLIFKQLSRTNFKHIGEAFVYVFSQEQLGQAIDADLKVGKKKTKSKPTDELQDVENYLIISGKELDVINPSEDLHIKYAEGRVRIYNTNRLIETITLNPNVDIKSEGTEIVYKLKEDQVGMGVVTTKNTNF